MTSTRRLAKARFTGVTWFVVLALTVTPFGPPLAAVTERIVTNRHTGLAMDGYDPVAYFTDSHARIGRPEFEYRFKGVIWRFSNAGNRVAFAQNAETYIPQYGGYDPVGIARGVAVAGNPTLWLLANDRLYLFYSPDALDSFKADAIKAIAAAEAKWPQVLQGIVP